ncbi:MAG: glutamate decarboxylase [Thermoanaerobacterales bacterium]|nr:glutamate decarboxylase [Bacillota bacterium]MDI6907647.1 glutamate decarboxylase [Thermoanaerobacterales bacterium]
MWTVVYIAPSKPDAERLRDALIREGLLVKLNHIGFSQVDGGSSVEILVPEGEVEEALEIINGL